LVTRFKEGERIRRAIESKTEMELAWALEYSRSRARTAENERMRKYWLEVARRVQSAADERT
jgi:hypothetical protein